MPIYEYECSCGIKYEQFRSMKAADPASCPSCGSAFGDLFRRVFSVPNGIVKGLSSAKTFGQASEQNCERLGKDGMEKMRLEQIAARTVEGSKVTRNNDDGSRLLDLSKVKNVDKYIRTGEKD